nr:MAG TPA: hypothetical protein [Caudoviricetes sp.]
MLTTTASTWRTLGNFNSHAIVTSKCCWSKN